MNNGAIGVFLFRIFGRGAVFITLLLLTRMLTIEEIGYFGLVSSTSYAFVYLFSFGLRHATAYFIGRSLIDARKLYGSLSLIILILAFFASFLASCIYVYTIDADFGSLSIVFSAALIFPLLFLYVFQGGFLGVGDIKKFNFSEFYPRLFFLCVVLFFYVFDLALSFDFVLLIYLLSFIFGALYAFRGHVLVVGSFTFSLISVLPHFLILVRYGAPLGIALGFVLLSPVASMFIAKILVDASAMGIFFLIYKLTDIVAEAASAVGMVVFSKGVRSNYRTKSLYMALKSAWSVTLFALCSAVVVIFFGYYFFVVLFSYQGPDFSSVMFFLALSLPFLCFSRVINPALAAQSLGLSGAWIQGVTFSLNCIFAFLFGSYFGVVGIAIALLLSRVINAFLFGYVISSVLRVGFLKVLIPNRRFFVFLSRKLLSLFVFKSPL